jgi:hypothetical protein
MLYLNGIGGIETEGNLPTFGASSCYSVWQKHKYHTGNATLLHH